MSYSSDMEILATRNTVASAGTREQLATGRPALMRVKSLVIRALTTNTGKIYVGGFNVSSTAGHDLDPGAPIIFEVTDREWEFGKAVNMTKIWIDAAVDGEGVVYTYELA